MQVGQPSKGAEIKNNLHREEFPLCGIHFFVENNNCNCISITVTGWWP